MNQLFFTRYICSYKCRLSESGVSLGTVSSSSTLSLGQLLGLMFAFKNWDCSLTINNNFLSVIDPIFINVILIDFYGIIDFLVKISRFNKRSGLADGNVSESRSLPEVNWLYVANKIQ